MYVRIAQFEAPANEWDDRIAEVRRRMQSGENAEMRQLVTRSMMLVDRDGGRGAGLFFCETEDDLRKVDELLDNATPPPGGGKRTSVQMYEVAVDSENPS
ncbi:MAG: hypothetical protein H0T61_06730 [Actinobacteria bacterium]|nr:hypothetical protein [Actinomycetota bacterium]